MAKSGFRHLIDPVPVRQLLESHHSLSGMAYGLFDPAGREIVSVGGCEICLRFHRAYPVPSSRCLRSGFDLRQHEGENSFIEYRCANGMIEAAMPVVIDGQHLATFFGGQFFYADDPPDQEFFRARALELGFERDDYLAALARAPRLPRDRIRDNLLFLRDMVRFLARMGTDGLRRHQELEKREERGPYFQALRDSALNQASDAIFLTDRKLRFVFVNEAACHSLRYDRDKLLQLTPLDIAPDLTPEMAAEMLAQLFATGRQKTFQTRHRASDGQIFPVEISISKFTHRGEQFGCCVARDITERKRMEEELRRKNTELEQFSYTVSHDLKSPLVTIRSFAGSIANDLAAGRHDRIEKDLARIAAAADKMATLLDDLLKLSKIGRVIKTVAPVEMAQLVRDVLLSLDGVIRENGVRVSVQPGLPTIRCDRQRMTEVVQNLVENAVKYRGEQAAPSIEIGQKEKEKETIFFVRDNGAGIAPQYRETIFGLFDRLDTTLPGTGIGLALARRIVEVHGGRIWVESDGPGKGSTFFFTVGGIHG